VTSAAQTTDGQFCIPAEMSVFLNIQQDIFECYQ